MACERKEWGRTLSLNSYSLCIIEKTLKSSDINTSQCRLLIDQNQVKEKIFPLHNQGTIEDIDSGRGWEVTVFNSVRNTPHQMVFKKWGSTGSYVFTKGWTREFIDDMAFNVGDTILLEWDHAHARFNLSLRQAGA